MVWIAVAVWSSLSLTPQSNAQPIHPDAIPVRNWPMPKPGDSVASLQSVPAAGSTPALVYIAITPCRVLDTRGEGGSGKTPGLVSDLSFAACRVRSSRVSVPVSLVELRRAAVAAAYSMNFVSVTPARTDGLLAGSPRGRMMLPGPGQP